MLKAVAICSHTLTVSGFLTCNASTTSIIRMYGHQTMRRDTTTKSIPQSVVHIYPFVPLPLQFFEARNTLEQYMNQNVDASINEIDNYFLHYMDYIQFLLAGQTPPHDL